MPEEVLLTAEEKMTKALDHLHYELQQVRTGRANPGLLANISVDYYGSKTPLNQVAAISVPEGNQLVIKPFDKSVLEGIEQAINASSLGLTPQNNGEMIRLTIPKLTEERRKDLVKTVKKFGEEGKVHVRNARQHANDALKKLELTEDDLKGYQQDVQDLTDKFVKEVENIVKEKENDLMTV